MKFFKIERFKHKIPLHSEYILSLKSNIENTYYVIGLSFLCLPPPSPFTSFPIVLNILI